MQTEKILNSLIENEFNKLEKIGVTINLRTRKINQIKYTIIFAVIFLIAPSKTASLIVLIIYFRFMYKNNNADVIAALAKKSPDKPISEIIEEELK